MAITDAGENKAWELLAASDPAGVCERAGVGFDAASGAYLVPSFGRRFSVAPAERLILNLEPEGEVFLKRYAYFFRLSVLWYLVKASPARPSGNHVKPAGLPGGEIFFKGSHVLPLEALAGKYARRPEAFLVAGSALGGRAVAYGDAAVELPALPKIPTTVILWLEDDEFPARADLLFDATGPHHLPLDILWSVAMLSVLPLL
jgi:hypothetical protein